MRSALFFCLCAGILTLSGCVGAFDPFQRPGNCAETGASNETIAEQVANKSDLIQGESEPGTNGIVAVGGLEKGLTAGTASGVQTTVTPSVSNASSSGGS